MTSDNEVYTRFVIMYVVRMRYLHFINEFNWTFEPAASHEPHNIVPFIRTYLNYAWFGLDKIREVKSS